MEIPPLESLLVKDGQLFARARHEFARERHEGLGSTSKNIVPFMNVPEIRIVGKGDARPISQPPGYWRYPFDLNAAVDPIWNEFFIKHISLNSDAAPLFENKTMILECIPENLIFRYDAIKAVISKTNTEYEVEREKLITRVEQDMFRRDAEAKQKAEARDKIEKAFDQLEL
jgi:hypothetical protein